MTWAEADIMAPQYWEFAEWAGLAVVAFVVLRWLWIGARK